MRYCKASLVGYRFVHYIGCDAYKMTENAPNEQRLAIQVKGLSKSFSGPPVLSDLDMEIPWGKRFVLFGGNGSGKTTLIKSLATLSRPDAGWFQVGGFDRRQGPQLRRSIGVVTHQPLLYADLTGYETLRFYGRMFRVPDMGHRIELVAEQMGVTRYLQARVGTLSHGMQKRLSLARALLHDPPILLLDEPETGLDQEALELLDGLLTSSEGAHRTVLMATHNLERGLSFGDTIAILAQGRIAYQESRDGLDETEFRDTFTRYLGAAA